MTTDRRLFRRFLPRPRAEAAVVCFPHAGGASSAFHGWAELLPETVELIAVQYPGRQDRFGDPMPASIPELAETVAGSITTPFRRPTAFFGHSMGALVAFEAARRLQPRFPSPLAALFASACKAPAERTPKGLDFGKEQLREYIVDLGGSAALALQQDEELWEVAAPVIEADLRLTESYRYTPGAPLTCPLIAFGGAQDRTVTPADIALWKEYAIGGAEVHVLEGGHFYFEDSLPQLLSAVAGALLQVPSSHRWSGRPGSDPSGVSGVLPPGGVGVSRQAP